jgi:hypothetical protein
MDPVDPQASHRREGEVRVRGRVGAAELDPLAFGASEYIGIRMHAERFRCE